MKRKFRCEVWYFKFKQKRDLKRHVKIIHEKVRSFKCKICDLSFQTLNRHVKSKHQEEKTFKCDTCEFACSRSDHLKKHKKCKHFEKDMAKKLLMNLMKIKRTGEKFWGKKLKRGEEEEIVSEGLTERKRSFKKV